MLTGTQTGRIVLFSQNVEKSWAREGVRKTFTRQKWQGGGGLVSPEREEKAATSSGLVCRCPLMQRNQLNLKGIKGIKNMKTNIT